MLGLMCANKHFCLHRLKTWLKTVPLKAMVMLWETTDTRYPLEFDDTWTLTGQMTAEVAVYEK